MRGICAKYAYFWISWLCILYKYAYSRTPWLCIFRKYAYSSITWLWILTNMHIAKIMWLWLWISKIVIFIVTQYAYCDIDGRPLTVHRKVEAGVYQIPADDASGVPNLLPNYVWCTIVPTVGCKYRILRRPVIFFQSLLYSSSYISSAARVRQCHSWSDPEITDYGPGGRTVGWQGIRSCYCRW